MPTTNPVPSADPTDLLFNAGKLDEVVNGNANSFNDRFGVARRTMAGIDAAADNVLNSIGYAVPVAYASGINLTITSQTIEFSGVVYAPKSSALPFTTSSWVDDSAKFRAIQVTDAAYLSYTPAGTGAAPTTVQAKMRETVSVTDFYANGVSGAKVDPTGVIDSTAGIQAAINRIKTIGGGKLIIPNGNYLISGKINIWGTFGYRGIHISGDNAQITSTHVGAAFHFRPDPRPDAADPAPQLKQRSEMSGVTFNGPGATIVGSVGILISDGATVDIRQCKARNYEKGLSGVGALICRFTEVELYSNRWGAWITSSATFAPNDIHFLACKIFENTSAVFAEKFPNGVITFNECEMEGNNSGGTASDGIVVFDFDRAGTVNIIGSHLEYNFGQWHIRYAGGATQSALNVVGSQLIPGNNNTSIIAMSNLYGSYGHLQIVGSRISSGLATQISMATGTSACIIGDPVANITGDLDRVVVIRNGRIATGVGATPANAGMRSKGSSSIAHDFEGQIRFVNAANTRLAYAVANETGALAFVHDVDNQGIQFNTKISAASAARLQLCRAGALSLEPGADNTYALGSAAIRWGTVYAGTGTINTSDAREKQQIRELSEAERAVAVRCKSLIRAFKFNDAVEQKGDNARIHFGVIAQDVQAAFEAEGLDASKYALFCYDKWDGSPEVTDENGNVISSAVAPGGRYGIRYEQLLAFIISAL